MSETRRISPLAALPVVLAFLVCLPAHAGKDDRVPDYAAVTAAIADILKAHGRLELPVERMREALKVHYIDHSGTIYWSAPAA
jgi:L,D-transpeptidase YcbB